MAGVYRKKICILVYNAINQCKSHTARYQDRCLSLKHTSKLIEHFGTTLPCSGLNCGCEQTRMTNSYKQKPSQVSKNLPT